MAMLSQAEDRTLRMSDVAGFTGTSLSRLSHLVKRLERSDWVRRTPDPSDGRYTLAILTGDGWTKVVDTAPGHVEAVRGYVFGALTKAQIRQLTSIGRRVMRAIDPDHPCLGPRPT